MFHNILLEGPIVSFTTSEPNNGPKYEPFNLWNFTRIERAQLYHWTTKTGSTLNRFDQSQK